MEISSKASKSDPEGTEMTQGDNTYSKFIPIQSQ